MKLPAILRKSGKVGVTLLVLNEIRGVLFVAPIVWAWIKTAG